MITYNYALIIIVNGNNKFCNVSINFPKGTYVIMRLEGVHLGLSVKIFHCIIVVTTPTFIVLLHY